MTTPQLPTAFKERVTNTFGEQGTIWLKHLPDLIIECEKYFNLKVKSAFTHQSFNFTAKATQNDGTEIVIKLCIPNKEVENEIKALEFMRGNGIVKLLHSDKERGVLLLEKLNPGEMLSTLTDDEKATHIAAHVMQKIWKPISNTHGFPTTHNWFDRLNYPVKLPAGFPTSLIDKAKQIALDLHKNMGEIVLLHGDLHHFNILSAQRQPWLAIDPKGIVGECEYELGALLRNPIPDIATTMNTKRILARRVDILSEILKFDRQKILGWSFAQAILASVWCTDIKSEDWRVFLKCASASLKLL